MAGGICKTKNFVRIAGIAFATVLLASCVGQRPQNAVCPAPAGAHKPDFDTSLSDAIAAHDNIHPGSPAAILVLSGGGAWGAYGAGFLYGWSQRPPALGRPRPQFDVVTGVSVGAAMAPYAFLGPQYDARLEAAFRGADADSAFAPRSVFTLPFWNALNDSTPMEQNLRAALPDDVIDAMRSATAEKRALWIGAVNFDTGAFTEFDLSALARDLPDEAAREAMVDRIMAAGAVPVFLPPRFIGGCMYMDGDVRENLFVSREPAAKPATRAAGTPKADIYVIINGTVGNHRIQTGNTLIDIAVRGFEIAEGAIQLNSLREAYDYAHARGYGFYWTSADDVVADPRDVHGRPGICPGPQSAAQQFDPAFTRCLFDAGLMKARDRPDPWRTDRP